MRVKTNGSHVFVFIFITLVFLNERVLPNLTGRII